MRNIAGFIALLALATCLLLAGRASVADGNQCEASSSPVAQKAVWRMEVGVDEAAFSGPSIRDRLTYNWTNAAKLSYRWTSTVMSVDAGTSTRLMAISAAKIGEGLPILERGDIVDVAVLSQGLDYGEGTASVILNRVCSAQDKPCLDRLRETQDGKVSGVEIKGGDQVVGHVRSSAAPAIRRFATPTDLCHGVVAAVLK
jgi:hypothetical protein